MSSFGFNPEEYVSSENDPVPDGRYNVVIKDTSIVDTNKKDGQILKVQYTVLDGSLKNRVIFANYNIHNPNDIAQKIGREHVNKILKALGIKTDRHEDMRFKKLAIEVIVKKNPGYDAQNEVKKYFPYTGEVVAEAKEGKAPWEQ